MIRSIKFLEDKGYLSERHNLKENINTFNYDELNAIKYSRNPLLYSLKSIKDKSFHDDKFKEYYGFEFTIQNVVKNLLKDLIDKIYKKWDVNFSFDTLDGVYLLCMVSVVNDKFIFKINNDNTVTMMNRDVVTMEELINRIRKSLKSYNHNYVNDIASELIDKKIVFDENKVNVIFGANGSGKTTILKELAIHAHCSDDTMVYDGWSRVDNPHTLLLGFNYNKDKNTSYVDKWINKNINKSEIDWDGSPVYYHNFSSVINCANGCFGIISKKSSLFGDSDCAGDIYVMNDKQKSKGQSQKGLFNLLINQLGERHTWDDTINNIKKYNINGKFDELISKIEEYNKVTSKNTVLLDEPESSMDMLSVIRFYKDVIPRINKNTQVIMVTHNPLIFMPNICNPDIYNIISLNDEYTSTCRNVLQS